MKKASLFLIPLLIAGFCGRSISRLVAFPEDKSGKSFTFKNYPLHKGYSWVYNVQTQVSRQQTSQGITMRRCKVTVVTDTIIHGYRVYGLTGTNGARFINTDPATTNKINYYAQTNNGLYYVAGLQQVNKQYLNSQAVCMLQLPAKTDQMWNTVENNQSYAKEWENYTEVNTAAGTFECIQLLSVPDALVDNSDYKTDYIQYFSEKGLVQVKEVSLMTNAYINNGEVHTDSVVIRTVATLESANF